MNSLPFTIYDFFAYLSSGSIVVAAIDGVFGYRWLQTDPVRPTIALFLILLAYLVGHLVAQFSSLLLERLVVEKALGRPARALLAPAPPRWGGRLLPGYFRPLPEETQRRIRTQAQARGVAISSDNALFLHAYGVVTQFEKAQARLDEFRNIYGFARNATLALFAAAVIIAVGICLEKTSQAWGWASGAFALGVGMFYRYLKFFRQYSYQLFVIYAELPLATEGAVS